MARPCSPFLFTFAVTIFLTGIVLSADVDDTDAVATFPRGHREPLGGHRDPDGHIDVIDEMITPQEFWDKYASQRRPALFKGAAKSFPAFKLWTDDYLEEKYGDMKVKLESKVEKDKVPVGEKGLGQDTILDFLRTYREKDSYIVSQLPDPMSHEVLVLPCLMCGTFKDRILEANLWLSSGGTKSLLHRDADNAFNCLLNGTKDWILIDPKYEDKIPIAVEAVSAAGGFALLDPDKVNLLKYPAFVEVPWQYANVTAGDCLFLPYGYWHRVLSYGSKNMAVSVLFSRLTQFKANDCDTAELDYTPLSEVNMVWGYDGYGEQTMGNPDPYDTIEMISGICSQNKAIEQDAGALFYKFAEMQRPRNQSEETFIPEEVDDAYLLHSIAENVVEILDRNGDGVLTCAELKSHSLDTWKTVGNTMDADPANTEEYEFAIFQPDEVRDMMEQAFDERENILRFADFAKVYTRAGGSLKIAKEAFAELEPGDSDYVSVKQIERSAHKLFALFQKPDKHDPSGTEFQEALSDDRNMDDKAYLETNQQTEQKGKAIHDEF